jgi:N-acetylmuramoyl-L-alanine amidase
MSKQRKRKKNKKPLILTGAVILVFLILFGMFRCSAGKTAGLDASYTVKDGVPDFITVDLLTVNPYSRPGIALKSVNGVVIHYTANQGSSAQANRDYFEGLKDSHETKASAHFVVGLDGEVIQCIPTAEMAYASNSRNSDTVAIECCYKKSDGSFESATYSSVIKLTAWLCLKYNLSADDVIRHYDVTGKNCPKYYVEHPDQWKTFRKDVAAMLKKMKENS